MYTTKVVTLLTCMSIPYAWNESILKQCYSKWTSVSKAKITMKWKTFSYFTIPHWWTVWLLSTKFIILVITCIVITFLKAKRGKLMIKQWIINKNNYFRKTPKMKSFFTHSDKMEYIWFSVSSSTLSDLVLGTLKIILM
jgi:hypothetical protein